MPKDVLVMFTTFFTMANSSVKYEKMIEIAIGFNFNWFNY